MRHRRRTRTLGRRTAHRKAMLRNMVTSLFEHGRIETTVIRAKELRRLADKMVTLAKDGGLHARRQALSVIRTHKVVNKLFAEIGQKFVDRNGGYTRIVRIGPRKGDGTMLAVVELATEPLEKLKSRRKPSKTAAKETVIPQAAPVKTEEEGAVQEPEAAEAAEVSAVESEKAEISGEEPIAESQEKSEETAETAVEEELSPSSTREAEEETASSAGEEKSES